ncbi:MAG TPA: MATE family efflux transporter [Petrimonas sp.]|nr:MATE family efflux transporter [Petrimonas sp.]
MESIQEKTVTLVESEFCSKSVISLFWKYSLFALAGMSLQIVQVLADGMFVGNGIGEMGLATMAVTLMLWATAVAIFNLLGIGGSSLAAMKLGNGDHKGAREVYGSMVVFAFIFSFILAIIVYICLNPLLTMFGATPAVLPTARIYSIIFLIGLPICTTGQIGYYFTRVAEKPFIASLTFIIPAIIAITVEYITIFKLHWGVAGSSLAGEICSGTTILLIPYLQFSNTPFKLRLSDLKINFKLVLESCKIGFPMFVIPISSIFATAAVNNLITQHGGTELHLAAYGIIGGYFVYVFTLFTLAFITGIQPVASYNYGAKLYGRVRKLITTGIVQSSIFIIALLVIVFIYARPIVSFFTGPDSDLLNTTIGAMVVWMSLYAFGNISQIVSGYFMAIERVWMALLNAVARGTVILLPVILITSHLYGLKGVWMAQPVADTLSFVLAMICIIREYKRLKKLDL